MFPKTSSMKLLCVSSGIIVLLILGGTAYMLWWHTIMLETRSVAKLTVVERTRSEVTVVHVSGLCQEGAYVIKRVVATVEGSSVNLFVYAVLLRPGATGWFEYDVTVPASVNEIRFGKDKVVIWTRRASNEKGGAGLNRL